jgi:prepilin-type N-terminal cleavage/methylation domain-containing protein
MKEARFGSRLIKTLRDSSRGVTLIEVLVALALFAIIGIAFAGGLGTASRAVLIGDIRTNAESLARTQMEYIKELDYQEAPSGGVYNYTKIADIPERYSVWSVNRDGEIVNGDAFDPIIAIPWDSENNEDAPEDNGLQKITLVIKHEGTYVITLEGYKVYR